MRVSELAQRLSVPYRDVRYVLEQGILPKGVEKHPGRGEHRELDPAQAFWLAIVLNLKSIGIRTPVAGEIADFTRQWLRSTTQNENWEFPFEPFLGRMVTTNEWYIEIGDMKYIRLVTNANPSVRGLYSFPWSWLTKRGSAGEVQPIVVVRVDLARLAGMMIG
jgi:hypothetical protein